MIVEQSYHIGFNSGHGARYALLPGDPGRVELIASFLNNSKKLCVSREYTTYIGELNGEKVLVMSTGMGGPSTAIGVEELYRTGVDTFIRVGTCGGMQLDVKSSDIVIASGAVRMEGTSKEYAPIEFPAIANLEVTNALVAAAKSLNKTYHVGVVQSKDSFYGQHDPSRMPIGYELENKWKSWIKAGCLASEMECAALYVVSSYLRCRAGAVLLTVWNQERVNAGLPNEETHDTTEEIKVAIEAIKNLIENDKNK